MEHKFPLGSFQRENGTTFSGIPFIRENFQWNEPEKLRSIYILIEISGILLVNGKRT